MTESKNKLKAELVRVSQPLEAVFEDKVKQLPNDHQELLKNIEDLTNNFEKISSILPPSDLHETTDKIKSLCKRLESCKMRISQINKRADAALLVLNNLNRNRV